LSLTDVDLSAVAAEGTDTKDYHQKHHLIVFMLVPLLLVRAVLTFLKVSQSLFVTLIGMLLLLLLIELPQALISQLKPEGRLIIPVGPQAGDQVLLQITRHADGRVSQKEVMGVRYVPQCDVEHQFWAA
jgi:hypothetical protein